LQRLHNIKDLLLSKATELFYEKGFASASVREIVKRAGVTNSVLYHHFKDKNELLYIIIQRVGRELIDELKEIQRKRGDGIEILKEMIKKQISIVKDKKKEARIFLEEEYQLKDKYRKKVLEQHRKIYGIYKKQLELLEKEGRLRKINKTLAAFGIIAAINWTYRWYKEEGELSIEDVAKGLCDIVLKGILK